MMGRLLRTDPRSFFTFWAWWCIAMAAMMLGPGHVLTKYATYALMHQSFLPDWAWGVAMVGNAVAIFLIVSNSSRLYIQLVTIGTAVFWVLVGFLATLGAAIEGHPSAPGIFSLMGGVYCLLSIAQFGARS